MNYSRSVSFVIYLCVLVNVAFPQSDSQKAVPLVDKIILKDDAKTPDVLVAGTKEIPCLILNETDKDVEIDRSTTKGISSKLTLNKSDIKDIVRGDRSIFLYEKIKDSLVFPFKSQDETYYTELLEKKLDPFLQEFPNAPQAPEVKAFREKIAKDFEQVKQGMIRIGTIWAKTDEYKYLKENYDCLEFIEKVKSPNTFYNLNTVKDFILELTDLKRSSYYPDAVQALNDTVMERINPDTINEQSGAAMIAVEKKRMLETVEKNKDFIADCEDSIRPILNRKVEAKANTWSGGLTKATPSGLRYYEKEARSNEQNGILRPLNTYLTPGNDLPYAQLQSNEVQKLVNLYKVIQEKNNENKQITQKLPTLERDMAASQRTLQTDLRNEIRKIKTIRPEPYKKALEQLELFKTSWNIYKGASTHAPEDTSKFLSAATNLKGSWPENVNIINLMIDVATYFHETSKKLIQEKNFQLATTTISQTESLLSGLTIKSGTALEERAADLRKQLPETKVAIKDAEKTEREAQILRDKRAEELRKTIDELFKNKDWEAVVKFEDEIISLKAELKFKDKLETSKKNIAASNAKYDNILKLLPQKNLDAAAGEIQQAYLLWTKNPRRTEVHTALAEGYQAAFEAKQYEEALQWLNLAALAKTDPSILNYNAEIDKTNAVIAEIKKKELYTKIGIGAAVLALLALLGGGGYFIYKAKSKNTISAIPPQQPTA